MTEHSSTQLAMRICRVFTKLHPHGCVGHSYFLGMNHSAATLRDSGQQLFCSQATPHTWWFLILSGEGLSCNGLAALLDFSRFARIDQMASIHSTTGPQFDQPISQLYNTGVMLNNNDGVPGIAQFE